ncbi:MAG: GNAT family protein [Candidatus Aenigmatarchaeota archaeon]
MAVKIRKFSLIHAKDYKKILDNKDIKWHGKYTVKPIPLSDIKKYIRQQMKIKNYCEFAIIVDDKFVGTISIEKIDKLNKNANIGYWVAKSYRGKGIATKAVKLAVKFGFSKFKLKRIYATVRKDNVASCKVLENVGFDREGLLRKSVFRKGKFYDERLYSVLK